MCVLHAHGNISIGEFHFCPRAKKTASTTDASDLYCSVIQGRFELELKKDRKIVDEGEVFRIPPHSNYSLQNVQTKHGIIQFRQINR